MAGSNPLSCARVLASSPSRVRSQGFTINLLDKALVPMDSSAGPALRQIKELNAELINLKRFRKRRIRFYNKLVFLQKKLVVNPPKEVVLLGSEKWKDCVVGYFIDRKVLYADCTTETCQRLNYAKICVEIDIHSELLNSFDIVLANGDRFPIKVQVASPPSRVVIEAVLEPIDSVIAQEDHVLASGQLVGGSGLPSDEVLAEGVALLPSKVEFHDGLIQGVESVIIPSAKKSRGRNKGGGRK
ncbi:hypothetical protein RHSIM_Rhsim11G0013000 [Rhododendron simsii]|uniref:Uncharacterized protein n=1 Tax=Rhododendron simsii TaxID=118357 RepID=A0A834G8J3_RHOSS|nr:hypothetical protein RHSIM_Rhsim11G0013000 [Rhododendron simsii]